MLLVTSISISLVTGEFFLRIVLTPGDYLLASLVNDPILDHKLTPNSPGHDSWGYRNTSVPRHVDIVTIGDSQTYGVGAAASNSWPAKLNTLTDKNVYNLSLGGYGPPQYYYLLEKNALKLNPSLVLVGFYFGNDLHDAYTLVYTKDYWKNLRKPDFVVAEPIASRRSRPSRGRQILRPFRDWLSHHSVLYRLAITSFGNWLRVLEVNYLQWTDDNITMLENKEHNISTTFEPWIKLGALNVKDPKIQEGLRVTLELLYQMKRLCVKSGVDCAVVLIPTKESVFSRFIENKRGLKNSDIIDELLINERAVNKTIKEYLRKNEIGYIDVLPALKGAVERQTIYPQNEDGHPTKEGYQIIAEAVAEYLRDRTAGKRAYKNDIARLDIAETGDAGGEY